jgi:DNA-binding MarR family transcriptional regulator
VAGSLQQEIKKRLPFSVPEQETALNLFRTTDALALQFTRMFREYGLSSAQYNILRILRGEGDDGLPCLEIAARMITCVPDITRLIDRLEQARLVSRARSGDDRRVVHVRIVPKGLALLERLDEPVITLHKRQIGHLTRQELAELNRLLVKARDPVL